MRRVRCLCALLLVPWAWLGGSTASADGAAAQLVEWLVPWEKTRPRDPYVENAERTWFVGQQGDYVAYLIPASGEFRRYELERGAGPHNLIVDANGLVWYAGNRAAHIGKLDPESGEITKYPMPEPEAGDPHTLVFDGESDIWFSVQRGNFVGKLTVATGEVQLVPVPTPRSLPYGIVVDSRNRPWFTEFGTNKLATVDPETFELREITLPRKGARPRRLVATSDGGIWYVDHAEGYLGRYDPERSEFQEWPAPGGKDSRPYGMAVDDQDRIWFAETGVYPNRFVGFDTESSKFLGVSEIESGGGSVRHMFFHAPSGTVWFGTDANTIGRALLP